MVSPEKLIASFDIDGVLNNYPFTFLDFLKRESGLIFESKNEALDSLGKNGYDFHKDAYRKSDFKYQVAVDQNICNLINLFKSRRFELYVSTSRPFHLYPNMYENTINWLKMSEVPFDKLIKKSDLISENFLIHFDDELDHIYELFNNVENRIFIHLSDSYEEEMQILDTKNKVLGFSKKAAEKSKFIKDFLCEL